MVFGMDLSSQHQHVPLECPKMTNLLDDLPLDHVYDEHGILNPCNEDLSGALGGEAHALQVFHVRMSDGPYRRPPPYGHVNASGPQGNDALLMKEELPYGPIILILYAEGGITLELAAVKGDNSTLFPVLHQHRQAYRQIKKPSHTKLLPTHRSSCVVSKASVEICWKSTPGAGVWNARYFTCGMKTKLGTRMAMVGGIAQPVSATWREHVEEEDNSDEGKNGLVGSTDRQRCL